MTHLKIAILILFQFCFIAAGHGGGPFVMLWIFSIINAAGGDGGPEALIGLLMLALQILAIVAIKKDNERLMFVVTIFLSLMVVAATIISSDALSLVIWSNGAFLITAGIYIVKYLRNQGQPEEIDSILTD